MTLPVISVNSAPEPDMAKQRSPRIWCLNWKVSQNCYKTGQVNLFLGLKSKITATFLWPTKLPYSFPTKKDALNLKITTLKSNTFKSSVVCSLWLLLGCWVWEQRISVILLDLEKLEEKLTCYSCCMARKWTFLHILEHVVYYAVFFLMDLWVGFISPWRLCESGFWEKARQSLWRSVLEIRESLQAKSRFNDQSWLT